MTERSQRLDKWLWYARLAKTRTLAAGLVAQGRIRVNRIKVSKPSASVKPGDVVTATVGRRIKVLRIAEVGHRRGPASEAMQLYEDLSPPVERPDRPSYDKGKPAMVGARDAGAGRPTKRDRRLIDRLRSSDS